MPPEYKSNKKEKRFQRDYNELILQTLHARAHLELWEQLNDYKDNYLRELNQAPHFFQFTMLAHYSDALLTLSRILDEHKDSLSVWKFLNFAEQNRDIFSNEAFAQRMRQKPYHKSLIISHTPITHKEIAEDRQRLKNLEVTTSRIMYIRDKVLAHIDRTFYSRRGGITKKKYLFQRKELNKIYEVIDTLLTILNRYSTSYSAGRFLEKYLGEDDVNIVMNAIRFRIQERKKQLEALKRQTHNKE
ncbi:hypothetical protein ACFLWM_02480 [Chloroflexota bacterium]